MANERNILESRVASGFTDTKEMIIVYFEEMSSHSPERNRELETLFLSTFELVLKTSHLCEP